MKRIFFILTALLLINGAHAQKETNIWHFGYNSGLDFNQLTSNSVGVEHWWNGTSWSTLNNVNIKNAPKVISGYVHTHEGCFTISDEDGKLLMSSDGSTLYNKNGTAMNATPLGGNASSTQSGIVIPKPGSLSRYYVVSVDYAQMGKIQYAEVDMSLNGGLGGIVSQNNNISSFNADESIAAIPHSNGVDYWLINRTINTYYVWLVSSTGFTFKSSVPVGSTVTTFGDFIGELIVSPDGTRLAAMTFYRNELLSADFDPATGQITNTRCRSAPVVSGTGLYGGCFSPNGEYLYFTFILGAGDISASYCASWNDLKNSNPKLSIILPVSNIHRGPDGRLYGIRKDSRALFIIEDPDVGDLHTKYIGNFFSATQMPRTGLPSFLSSYFKTNLSVYPLACKQNPREISVEITSGGASPAASIDWDFGDGVVVTGQAITPNATKIYSQIHTYATPGTKTITITPRAADGTAKALKVFQIEVIPCAIKTNRMIRTNLKDQGEP